MRDEERGAKTGGSGADTVAVVYEPELTLDLPRDETVGTAMNALAHAAEALYAGPHEDATTGAALIARWLPVVVEDGRVLGPRTELLRGCDARRDGSRGARAVPRPRDGPGARGTLRRVPRGAERALPRAGAPVQPGGRAGRDRRCSRRRWGRDDAPTRVEALARLGGFERLRDLGIPEGELADVAAQIAQRPAARSNPRPASPEDIEALLRSIW